MKRHHLAWAALMLALGWSAEARAARCTIAAPGITTRVAIGGTGRAMLIHWPSRFAGRAPLVFLLHGSTGKGADILADSKLGETGNRHGFIVAAPDGGIPAEQGFVWNIPGVPTVTGKVPGPADPDDVAYLAGAIDWMAARGCADRTRVYATGLSGGGRMTSWLGCVASSRFAAIAPVVGLRAGNPSAANPQTPDPASCRPARPVPVIAFAGAKDNTNPIAGGGAPYWQYSMRTAEVRWADLDGCRKRLAPWTVKNSIQARGFTQCKGGAAVIARIDPNGEHNWRVADNEAMWAFFAYYRRQ
jgi:polyhydroxybutyrate depolymerase